MTQENKMRFKVITNDDFKKKDESNAYHSNPIEDDLQEKFMKFVHRNSYKRFSVEDLLKW